MAIHTPTIGEQTERLDALPRLDYRSRHRAVPSEHPAPGCYLTVEDDLETRLLPLEQPLMHIGRGFSCEVCLEDQSVSRRHAIIKRTNTVTEILDERSSNGTYVNGQRVSAARLKDGDVIVLGHVILGYLEI
ncbi:MAG TPA: FHA domain-containing protein [Solirubrobacteraceae bacterium]|jgi:pSer/pThr/pTyr-binding forkhead associated (FHA) protein